MRICSMKINDVIKALGETAKKKLILKKSVEDNPLSSFKAYKICKYELYYLFDGKPEVILKKEYTEKILEAEKDAMLEKVDIKFLKDLFHEIIYGDPD